jgi:hypothetical protein
MAAAASSAASSVHDFTVKVCLFIPAFFPLFSSLHFQSTYAPQAPADFPYLQLELYPSLIPRRDTLSCSSVFLLCEL